MPDRSARFVVLGFTGLWGAAFASSFVAAMLAPPVGEGFARGLNAVGVWAGWQLAGLAVATVGAAITWVLRGALSRRMQWVGYAPLVVDLVVLGWLVLFAS